MAEVGHGDGEFRGHHRGHQRGLHGAADEDAWLRAAAGYTDRRGSGKTAESPARQVGSAPPTAPAFADANDDGTADPVSLTVPENAAAETAVGTVAATDADGDTLTHSVGGADAAVFNDVFALDAATGEITVKAGASPDFEAKDSYAVTISVTDGEDDAGNAEDTPTADDTVEVTVSVTDLEEAGSVSLSTASPQVNAEVTATVSDPDGSVSDVSWRWRKSATETGSFEDITGATNAAYTPGAADEDAWLRAAAGYTDRRGSGKTAESPARQVGSAPPTAPAFADANDDGTADPVSLTVPENAAAETAVGTVAATDADGDTLAHSVGGADAAVFNDVFALDAATGAITVKAGASPDFEAKDSYAVTISVTDGEDDAGNAEDSPAADDTVEVTVSVTDLEEAGSVSLSTASPQVNAEVTATVSDPDGSVSDVSWRWRKSETETGSFEDITGATNAAYTPGAADEDAWLRAAAGYTDRRGSGKTAESPARQVGSAPPTAPAFADANDDGDADPVSLTVPENAAAETAVGTVAATDADGDTLAHSVGGADASDFNGVFALDAATGRGHGQGGGQPRLRGQRLLRSDHQRDRRGGRRGQRRGQPRGRRHGGGDGERDGPGGGGVGVAVHRVPPGERGGHGGGVGPGRVGERCVLAVAEVGDGDGQFRGHHGGHRGGLHARRRRRGRLAAGRGRLHRPPGLRQDGGEPGPAGRVRAAHGAGLRRRQR